ncbi:Rrf2 family transcriptional regulator [Arenimonas caeni]|jgi:Rrf2 family nitric oxide-sensitive transcriptional repressor|uniref:RrF2 family transcriptional regulator n=1 Tax=Arenimonas caeni TaxID=2058085 RepID=UPI002A362F27|nr:Rrf2 family transcriptional regulator [Arenimonas caeni]MDY0022523.1 Rrf2 family transcriptional regulator [Arenimonas caeni]
MKLTDYTDYTLRVLIYLGLHQDELVTIQQVADGYRISKNHLMKIVNQLSQSGVVAATRGRNGGVRLALPPERINIGAIVRATEADFRIVECFDQVNNQCVLSPACRLRAAMHEALEAFFRVLDGLTLADVIANAGQIRAVVAEQSLGERPGRRKSI